MAKKKTGKRSSTPLLDAYRRQLDRKYGYELSGGPEVSSDFGVKPKGRRTKKTATKRKAAKKPTKTYERAPSLPYATKSAEPKRYKRTRNTRLGKKTFSGISSSGGSKPSKPRKMAGRFGHKKYGGK